MTSTPWTTRLRARLARAGITLVSFAAPALGAWVLSKDYVGLWPDTAPWIISIAVASQPVVSQAIGNYAPRIVAWLKGQE